ncbi:MAG: STAS domain-containing protein [Nonomuraea sp.]|nr:STAS domain-containing protein [Nonomuraea sp.]NUP64344.1 STAS domain-containing protein [Nonomuraea sp.]NUP78490.1 STAS domain-containing protein [Nonomuraea sp.]NUT38721.1 STAS domain-containing protein [Thermoactinospora sp.]
MTVIDTAPPGRAAPTVVRPTGEIDIFAAMALRKQLMNALRRSSALLIDLSGVSFSDSSGLAVLVGIQHRARLRGVVVTLSAPSAYTSHLLRVTGLGRSLAMVA